MHSIVVAISFNILPFDFLIFPAWISYCSIYFDFMNRLGASELTIHGIIHNCDLLIILQSSLSQPAVISTVAMCDHMILTPDSKKNPKNNKPLRNDRNDEL